MLKNVHFKNFICFRDLELPMICGLNVLTGESGTGKSSILKAIYSLLRSQVFERNSWDNDLNFKDRVIESRACAYLELAFRVDGISRLISQFVKLGTHCELALNFDDADHDFSFDFYFRSHNRIPLSKCPSKVDFNFPFFFPRGDGLVFLPKYQIFTSSDLAHDDFYGVLYKYEDSFRGDLTANPFTNTPRGEQLYKLHNLLKDTLQGTLYTRDYQSYSIKPSSTAQDSMLRKPLDLSLLSDGLRKLAYIMILIENGTLSKTDYFFWDNPEIYLDPKLIKVLAETLLLLSKAGIQVFIATQSSSLIRKLNSLVNTSPYECVATNFISLKHMYADAGCPKVPEYIGVEANCSNSIEGLKNTLLMRGR